MGRNYAYELIAPRSGADALLGALADALPSGYGNRIRSCLPWRPNENGIGIAGHPSVFDIANYYDVVFALPHDEDVAAYFERNPRPTTPTTAHVAHVGLVYMKFGAGERYARLELSAATSDMSTLFWTPGVEHYVRTIAKAASAEAAFFDYEDDATWNAIYPKKLREMRRPSIRRPRSGAEIDAHAEQALANLS